MSPTGPSSRWAAAWQSKTYDVLPALSVRGKELRSSLRVITAAWMFGSVWMIGIGGATLGRFAKLTGFTDFHWGMWQAVGFAAMLAQLPAAYLIEKTNLRKLTFLQATTIHRALWMFVGLAPVSLLLFPSLPPAAMIWAAMALIFVSQALGNVGAPAWITWMSELIPSRIRGRYFARRNVYALSVQILATLAIGMALDLAIRGQPAQERLVPAEQPVLVWTLAAVFAVAGLAGVIDILLFRRIRDIARPSPPQRVSLGQILTEPLRNRRFLHFAGAWSVLTFGIAVAGPYFVPVCQDTLKFNATWMNFVLMVCMPVGGLVSSRFWGRVIDRWGRKPVMATGLAGTALSVWIWLLVPGPGHPALSVSVAAVVVFVGGFIWTGLGIAQFNVLLGFSNEGGRSAYVAATSILAAVAGVIGGLVGGVLAQQYRGFRLEIGPMVYVNYHIVFIVSGAIRALSVLFLIGMQDPGAKPTRVMVRALVMNAYHNLGTLILWPMRTVIGSRKAAYRLTRQDDRTPDRR